MIWSEDHTLIWWTDEIRIVRLKTTLTIYFRVGSISSSYSTDFVRLSIRLKIRLNLAENKEGIYSRDPRK